MRTYRSTAMAIIDLTEYRTTALNKRKHVMLNFINLKNAFDTIDHDILILNLYYYGIQGPGISQKWIQSNLNHRNQFVECD